MSSIADLYAHYETLDAAKEKAAEHETEYRAIIDGAKTGPPNDKRLASQFIVKFQKFFPDLKSELIDVLLSLCEDPDVSVRRQVVKDIETFCRDSPDLCQRTADTLTVLLQGTDSTELTLVQKCLVTLLKTNAKGTLDGIFQQVVVGADLVRERALTFIVARMKVMLVDNTLPKDVEECLLNHCRKVLEDVSGTEFTLLMQVLAALPSMNTLHGRQQLLNFVTEQAELGQPFQAEDVDGIQRLTECIKEAMPLFSKNVHSTQFVVYICTQVLPLAQNIVAEEVPLDLYKFLAEMSVHCGDVDGIKECIDAVFTKLVTYMPLPKEGDETEPNVEYTYVECLMYTFHQLARKSPEFLTAVENAERLRDFRVRLQYLARDVQMVIKLLRKKLTGLSNEEMKTEENVISALAIKTNSNIHALIKDLFYNPPAYKAIVPLSFKVTAVPTKSILEDVSIVPLAGVKRGAAITPIRFGASEGNGEGNGEPAKKLPKDSRKMYVPPSGKFSGKAGDFSSGGGGRRGRGVKGRGFRQQW